MQSDYFSDLHQTLANIALKKRAIDLELIFNTLETSTEVDIVGLCFEALFSHRNHIIDQLKLKLNSAASKPLEYAIIFVCSMEPDLRAMSILIEHYIKNNTYRQLIKQQGFEDLELLAISLMDWLEHNTTQADEQKTVTALCSLIPRKILLSLPNFSHSKLATFYFTL